MEEEIRQRQQCPVLPQVPKGTYTNLQPDPASLPGIPRKSGFSAFVAQFTVLCTFISIVSTASVVGACTVPPPRFQKR